MAALGSLVVKLGLEYAQFTGGLDKSEQAALAASKKIQDTFDGMKRGIAGAAGDIAGTLASALSLGAAVGKLVQVQREFDVLNASLKTVTGSSAAAEREMAWLKDFARETPFGLAQATQGFVKMKALGLDPTRSALTSFGNTASAMGKDLNQMIEAVADASTGEFERLKEFGIKAKKEGDNVSLTFQGVTTTIKNSASEITKYLEDIGNVQFGGAMAERAKTLDGAISELGDTWDELFRTINERNAGTLIYDSVKLANGAIEDATTIIKAMTAAYDENGQATGAMATIQNGIATVFETVAVLGANLKYVLVQIGTEIGGLAAQVAQAAQFNFSGVAAIREQMVADAEEARRQIDATTARILGARKAQEEYARWSTRNASAATDPRRIDLGRPAASGKPTGPTDSDIKAANKALQDQAKLLAELSGLSGSFAADWQLLTTAYKSGKLSLDGLTAAQAALLEKQPAIKAAADEEKKAQELLTKSYQDAAAERLKIVTAMEQTAVSAAEQNQSLRDEIELIGLTEEQQTRVLQQRTEAIILTKEATLAELERASAITGTMTREQIALQAEIEALKERNALLGSKSVKNTAVEAAKKAKDEWEKTTDQINQSLTDALMRGFESGKDFAKNLRDTVVNMFKTMVLRPVISAVLSPVSGAIAGVMGGGGGSGSNPIGMASNAYSMYNAGSQAWTLGSQYMAGTMSGANVLGTAYANATGGGIDALLATNGAYGTAPAGAGWMGQLGTAGGVFAAITGLAAAFGAFRKEVSVGGGLSGTFGAGDITGYDLRRESGYLFGGPDYTMVNPAQKIAELEKLRGTGKYLGGGWAGADAALEQEIERLKITYKDMIETQGAQSKALQTAYEALRTSAGDMADSLGLGSDAVRAFTTTVGTDVIHPDTGGIGIKLDGLKPEEVQAKIQEALATASNELAQQVIGSWKTVTETVRNFAYEGFAFEDGIKLVEVASTSTSKLVYVASEYAKDGEKAIDTLTRLSTNLATVNTAFKNLGWTLMDKSLAGADAAGKFADKLGGLENFAALAGTYYENFYSEAEKTANVTRDITAALADVGLQMPTTRDEFRALVEAQMALGPEGATAAAGLLAVSGAFASLTQEVEKTAESVLDFARRTSRTTVEFNRIKGLSAVGNSAALARLGVPGYASGGYHPGGLRLVGEDGPELEVTGPSQIISSPVTAQMLRGGGADTARLEALVEKLTAEVASLRAETRAVVTHTATTARIIKRVTPDGDAIATREAAPV